MEQVTLSVETRQEKGKSVARKLRAAGRLPGVVYGIGENVPVVVDPRTIERILRSETARNKVYKLEGSGIAGKNVLVKDYQVDPVSRRLLHVDLLEIDVSQKITVTVPVTLIGKAAGVASGGVLNIIEREVQLRCLPTNVPTHIEVDVTALEIGDSIHLDSVKLPEGVEKALTRNETLVACVPPAKEEDAQASLAPSAEPEVITAKKPEEGAKDGAAAKDEKKK